MVEPHREERSRWFAGLHLSWPMLLVAGWLLYEFTAQPGLAALVACAKFGWPEVRTAFWLRRVDPDRPRGSTCFWSYLTFGLWKVAILSTLAMIVIGLASLLFNPAQRGQNGLSPVIGGALVAASVGFGLSFLTTYVALWSAHRNGVRIWLGQAANRARKERFWPPSHGRINAAPFVAFTCLILTIWLLVLLALGLSILANANGFGVACFWLVCWCGIFGLVGLHSLTQRVIARSPQDCWASEDEEMVFQPSGAEESVSEA